MDMAIVLGDLAGLIACLVAWSYVFGIWRMVRAPSRFVLLITISYMLLTRIILFILELDDHIDWLENHRTLIILPTYVLLAVAFGLTYYELRGFHFDRREPPEEKE